jgi:hypothetical protein
MKITVGSKLFFSTMEGFKPSDLDFMEIKKESNSITKKQYKLYDNDYITYYFKDKETLLNWHRRIRKEAIDATHLLVPQIAELFELTIEDVRSILDDAIPKLKPSWSYQQIIWNAYKSNNAFTLTQEQREAAYQEYLSKRPHQNVSHETPTT